MPLLPALVPVLFAIFAALGANPVSESQVLRVPFGISRRAG